MDCLSNLDKCKASCCKSISFDLNLPMHHPLEDYYCKRGLKVIRNSRTSMSVIVPHHCAQLDDDLKCKLHGTPQKPALCRQLNAETAKTRLFRITEGCIYGK